MKHHVENGKIGMPVDTFIKEHERLLDVLKHGKRDVQKQEAARQEAEMKMLLRHPDEKPHLMVARHGAKHRTDGDKLVHEYEL